MKKFLEKLFTNSRFTTPFLVAICISLTPVLYSQVIQLPIGEPGKEGVLLFQSGFEPGTTLKHGNIPFTSDDDLIGRDNSVPTP